MHSDALLMVEFYQEYRKMIELSIASYGIMPTNTVTDHEKNFALEVVASKRAHQYVNFGEH